MCWSLYFLNPLKLLTLPYARTKFTKYRVKLGKSLRIFNYKNISRIRNMNGKLTMLATINGDYIFSLLFLCKVIDVVSGPEMSKNNYLLTHVRVLFARQPACRGLLNISIKTNFLNVNQFDIHAHQHDPLETGIILLCFGNF